MSRLYQASPLYHTVLAYSQNASDYRVMNMIQLDEALIDYPGWHRVDLIDPDSKIFQWLYSNFDRNVYRTHHTLQFPDLLRIIFQNPQDAFLTQLTWK